MPTASWSTTLASRTRASGIPPSARRADATLGGVGDREIDRLVVSHPNSDHLSNADDLLAATRVIHIVHTGFERVERKPPTTWKQ